MSLSTVMNKTPYEHNVPKRIHVMERRAYVIMLRREGLLTRGPVAVNALGATGVGTWEDIAEKVKERFSHIADPMGEPLLPAGYDRLSAMGDFRDAKNALNKQSEDMIFEIRQMRLEQLESVINTLLERITSNEFTDVKSVTPYLSALAREAKYLGLDSPDRSTNINYNYDVLTDEQLERIAAGEPENIVFQEAFAERIPKE